jgi:predicted RNase H-like nuclease
MKFIGIDLAWSRKKRSGCAYLEGDSKGLTLRAVCQVQSDEEIVQFVHTSAGCDPAIVSIDAPLVVPNVTGMRRADAICTKLFGSYEAQAHSANRTRLSPVRGEAIGKLLDGLGFTHDPNIAQHELSRKYFEVYPHPAMVVLGDLPKTLKYKEKWPREVRLDAFGKYEELLSRFVDFSTMQQDVRELRGNKLKAYEDQLDAIFCGVIAWYAWNNPHRCALLGTVENGYILTPVFETMTIPRLGESVIASDKAKAPDDLRSEYDFDYSKPPAKTSSANASNSPAWNGPCAAQMPSPPYAAPPCPIASKITGINEPHENPQI